MTRPSYETWLFDVTYDIDLDDEELRMMPRYYEMGCSAKSIIDLIRDNREMEGEAEDGELTYSQAMRRDHGLDYRGGRL